MATAVRAYTAGGAYASFAEADRGTITRGRYADLVLVSRDLFEPEVDPRAILDTRVLWTMVDGEIVYRAE